MNRRWILRLSAAAVLLCLARGASAADEITLRLDPAASSVSFTLAATLHTVHGRLGATSGSIAFDPSTGAASGDVVIDLAGADTGIERRDRKMHNQVLDSEEYATAVYHVQRIDLPEHLQQGRNDLQLHGILDLKGASHAVDVPVEATVEGDRVVAAGEIEIPYVAWGLRDPSFFVLRVAKQVHVELQISGRLEGDLAAASAAAVAAHER